MFFRMILSILSLFIIGGCGGSNGSKIKSESKNNNTTTITKYSIKSLQDASSFLQKATFGSSQKDIDNLVKLNDYEKWIDEQFKIKPTYHMDWIYSHAIGVKGVDNLKDNSEDWQRYSDALLSMQRDAWLDIAVNSKDQLRQRVAFALSEIFVISKNGPLDVFPDARVSYYDILVKDAFSNFEKLLQDVTYHPAMGKYLSFLGNKKHDPKIGNHPDENYAREVMQLFSIGLYQLNIDGTKKSKNGKLLATYNQKDIQEMAKIFTGLSDDNGDFDAEASFDTYHSRTSPMVAFEQMHDKSEKKILLSKKVIPKNQSTKSDINLAIKYLANHPNTAPFISRQLIQRLVTSNPSKEYIKRVANVFNSNSKGKRGDLKAVIKAILLDKEAFKSKNTNRGKFREPLLYVTHLFRAFHAKGKEHILKQEDEKLYKYKSYNLNGTGLTKQEGPLEALTVFNYFTPNDAPYKLKERNLVAPELTIYGKKGIDELIMGLITKNSFVYKLFDISAELDIKDEIALANEKDYNSLIERLNLILTANNLSIESKKIIKNFMIKNHNKTLDGYKIDDERLVRYIIGLIMTSPDYALQR